MEDATAASITENNEQKNTHMFVLSVRVNDIEKGDECVDSSNLG